MGSEADLRQALMQVITGFRFTLNNSTGRDMPFDDLREIAMHVEGLDNSLGVI